MFKYFWEGGFSISANILKYRRRLPYIHKTEGASVSVNAYKTSIYL